MQLRASGPVCLLALVVAALDWAFGSRRANDLPHPSLSLLGQSLYPPVCLFQVGRKTRGGETGINWLMRPCLPRRGQNLCMYHYFYITNFSYDFDDLKLIQSKLNSYSLLHLRKRERLSPVSYTHLTLPTIYSV